MTIHATPGRPPLRPGDQTQTAAELQEIWDTDPRWDGVERTYSAEDVIALRGSVREESTLAHRGAENLWNLLHTEDYIRALGAYTGGLEDINGEKRDAFELAVELDHALSAGRLGTLRVAFDPRSD